MRGKLKSVTHFIEVHCPIEEVTTAVSIYPTYQVKVVRLYQVCGDADSIVQ